MTFKKLIELFRYIGLFILKNWFQIIVIAILLAIYFRIETFYNEDSSYIIKTLDSIESELDGFYSDWFGRQ